MYSRMKRKCSFIVLVVMVVSLLMVSERRYMLTVTAGWRVQRR